MARRERHLSGAGCGRATLAHVIIDSQASLLITSETHTSAEVTRVLGIEPSRSWEVGDPRGKARDGRPQRYHTRSGWQISASEGERGSVNGFMGLAAALEGKEHLLAELRQNYEMSIWWDGLSDSEQPGFYFFRIAWLNSQNIIDTIDLLRKKRPDLDIEVLGPGTFLNLYKKSLLENKTLQSKKD